MTKEEYNKALAERIEVLMKLSTLDIILFSEFVNISEPHLYAIFKLHKTVMGKCYQGC